MRPSLVCWRYPQFFVCLERLKDILGSKISEDGIAPDPRMPLMWDAKYI